MKKKIVLALCVLLCSAGILSACSDGGSSAGQNSVTISDEDIEEVTGGVVTYDNFSIIYSNSFEDGDVSKFSARSADDPTSLAVTEEIASAGKKSLCASGRKEGQSGPVLKLDGICETNKSYSISFAVMQKDRTAVRVGLEYKDQSGAVQTKELFTTTEGGRWHKVTLLEFSIPAESKDAVIWFEGGTSDMYIDNVVIVGVAPADIEYDIASLSEVFKDDFKVGTALTPSDLKSKNTVALTEKHFSASITVGNELKPDYVLDKGASEEYYKQTGDDEHPQVSFSSAKSVLDYARAKKIPVRVHTLIWHSQTPVWFFKEGYDPNGNWVTPEKMNARMENYIKAYFEKLTELYPDIDFYACDVVNEAWMEDGRPRKAGDNKVKEGTSAWVQVYGDNSFIEKAFTYARKYAPEGCKLYYNDYNEYMDGKLKAIINMAKDLKEKGIIDGIGMQSHLDARTGYDAYPTVKMYNNALDKYAELGLDIQITELDATVPKNSGDKYFETQAEYYKGIIKAIYDHKDSVSALIFWGLSDDKSWRSTQQPLLFDRKSHAKPAFYSVIEDYVK